MFPRFLTSDLGGGPSGELSRAHDALFDAHLHISEFSQRLWENSDTRSILIFGGVDTDRFHPADKPPAEFRAIFVGRILPHKGIDVLIDAMPDDMQLDVIDRAYDARYFDDLADRATGKMPGQTLLEGMASGLPAICTDVGAMPEVVVDGGTGFVVPGADVSGLREKLVWLRDNPESAKSIGNAARHSALEHFSWKSVVDRCLSAYAS